MKTAPSSYKPPNRQRLGAGSDLLLATVHRLQNEEASA
jgi:hypothetical protein